MTKEEIISNLLYMKHSVKEDTIEDITINEAIKVLQQEPCTDAISRQAAIDACLNGWNKDYKEIVEEIRALPPVTAEKVGQWEWKYDSNPKIGYWYCSQCHDIGVDYYDYCPYCGAKMLASTTGAERIDKE